jgi:NAD(P)-dependent dehydrogenase (short-subunit alcohol dehydrogenase family)
MEEHMQPTQKIALITGANKGIGFEVARQLGKAGQIVLIGARNAELGEAAAAKLKGEGIDARFVALDLDKAETISAAAAFVEKEFGRLDTLVNNAAIVDPKDGPPSVAGLDGVRRIMETNFIGSLAVTQAMLELVKKSSAGRIVNVSSGLGSLTLHGDPDWKFASVKVLGYCASKSALNMMTVQLAYELRDTNIKVNAADPGYTATDLNGNSGYQTIEEGAAETVRLALLPDDGVSGTFSNSDGIEPW